MRKVLLMLALFAVLLIGGCMPSLGDQEDEVIQDSGESVEETVIIPDVKIKEEYYKTLLPFKKSASRGLITETTRTKYDIQEVEEGLLRLSTQHYDPKNHYFQEGQYIDEGTARLWLGNKSKDNPDGLNPSKEGMTEEEEAESSPTYLAHIVEQNYLVMTKDNKVKLEGISIGLAMNTIHYSSRSSGSKETEIPDKEIEEQGTIMAEEIIKRLRSQQGLEDIPIVVGLYKQGSRQSIMPGTYFATVFAEKGKAPSGWKLVDEKYVLFPGSTNDEKYRDANTAFLNFKQAIEDYFPSFVNVIGRGHYKGGKLSSLEIEMPIQFFGTSETIGFTQYVTSLLPEYLPDVHTEVSITSVNGPEALIVKEAGDEEAFVHIYGY